MLESGRRLREAREGLGLTLAQVAGRTRIPLRVLRAIEVDDPRSLPPRPYLRGHLRAYGRVVGVDVERLLDEAVAAAPAARVAPPPARVAPPPGAATRYAGLALGALVLTLLVAVVAWAGHRPSNARPSNGGPPGATQEIDHAPT